MKALPFSSAAAKRAFSLIELLVVVAIIALMLVMAAPTMSSAFKGSKLNQGAEVMRNFLANAHLVAIKNNLPVQVRFYTFDDPDTPETTEYVMAAEIRLVRMVTGGTTDLSKTEVQYEKVDDLKRLPPGIVISSVTNQSTLVDAALVRSGQDDIKGVSTDAAKISAKYFAFQFRPDGTVDLDPKKKWFITIMGRDEFIRNKEQAPSNYVCLQLNPYNGDIRWLQPN